MLLGKQIDKTVAKVSRMIDVYEPFLVEETIDQQVFCDFDGKTKEFFGGELWGRDFACATFFFYARNIDEGQTYHLFAETGGVEHQIFVNGKPVGMLDWVANAADAPSRTHKYLKLPGLKAADEVKVVAYYSHTIPGTMPYDDVSTFSLNAHYPTRPYKSVALVKIYAQLQDFCDRLRQLNGFYANSDGFARASAEKVYCRLFEILSLRRQRPCENSLTAATEAIDNFFAGQADNLPFVGLIGHSHLDTAWLWTIDETRRKLLRTVSNAVTLLNRYPEYKFFMSTVLYLKWIEEDSPSLFDEIRRLVSEGRFEPNGASWVECDGNLTGAEALCRQFVRGKLYLREKLNYESDTFWLPDTFGYSAALPQILKQCGVKYFLTTKLSWNDTNRFPYESFIWHGLDGSSVAVHFNSIHTLADFGDVRNRLDKVFDKRESNCMLMAYGFGDGGGGPSEDAVRRAIYTEKHFSEAEVKHITVSDFMRRLAKQQLPHYFGELYLELHRGTYTTNHLLKQNNRRLEEALHDAELISVFTGDKGAKKLTDELYDVLLINQFHDILPGTCIAEATDQAVSEQQEALKKARRYIAGAGGKRRYFNTLGFSRTEILPSQNGQSYLDLDGRMQNYAAIAFEPYSFGKAAKVGGKFSFDGQNIVTPQLIAKLQNGVLTSLVFHNREYVKGGFNLVRAAENVPYIYDNWDIDADYKLKEKDFLFVDANVVSEGDLMLVIRLNYMLDKTRLAVDMKLRADSPLVEFDCKLTCFDVHTLVRTYFDTTLFSSHYNCETQFGYVERNCRSTGLTDAARFEVCAHKWTDLSEKCCGLSLLSDSKYGVSCEQGTLGMTLHKSGTHPDSRGDVGESRFRFALLPHDGALGMETVRAGYCFNMLPQKTAAKLPEIPFGLFGDPSVVVETVKFAENGGGFVLRMYECLGATATVTLTATDKAFCETNILEDEIRALGSGAVSLTFAPFEIKTVVVK